MNFDPVQVGDLVIVNVTPSINIRPPKPCGGQVIRIQKRWLRSTLYHVYVFESRSIYKTTYLSKQ